MDEIVLSCTVCLFTQEPHVVRMLSTAASEITMYNETLNLDYFLCAGLMVHWQIHRD
jgi:hypothetical protein